MTRSLGWPCVRLTSKVIRYTQEDLDEIIRRHHGATASKPVVGIGGQTERSRRRAS